jgi:hypothetical protein
MGNKKSADQHDYVPTHVRHHLTSQPQSGLSIPQYCTKHSITPWSFYQWRKRYQSKLNAPSCSQISFNEIGLLSYSGCIFDIRFPSGITVSVHRGASHEELAGVVDILSEKRRC